MRSYFLFLFFVLFAWSALQIQSVKTADYDEHERSLLISQMSFEKSFGLSTVFIESTLMENGGVPDSANSSTLIKEAIHVISCGYEEKTEWGKEASIQFHCIVYGSRKKIAFNYSSSSANLWLLFQLKHTE